LSAPSRTSGAGEFVDAGLELGGADIHARSHRLVDQVDDELAVGVDVAHRIFGATVGSPFDAERDDRRIVAEHVEKRIGRCIDVARSIDRGDECDRARHHAADQKFVARGGGGRREIVVLHCGSIVPVWLAIRP
jgi:hypothetical protein